VTAPRPAVFLDRDGVLNEAFVRDGKPIPPRTVREFRLLPGVVDACAELREAGYALVVVTNQPDIARGTQTRAEVDRMHAVLREQLPVDEICVCPHDDDSGCRCRKPRPGLLLDAAARLDLDLARSVCVGDRWRDIEAGRRAGVRTIHIDCHYAERPADGADAVVTDLPGAVRWLQGRSAWRAQ
jgi:D-glycero-D-manno-heptose 1,7-bisphosphate phosphatase